MKLTKDDFDIIVDDAKRDITYVYIHKTISSFSTKTSNEIIEQILKNQEKAEKYDKFYTSPYHLNYMKKNEEIVERLKKLLNSSVKRTQSQLYQELQKILGDKHE